MTRISIDLGRRLGTVDRRIFGQFIEHIGRCIYGGVYDEGSPLADARGFRRDVLEAARPLAFPILRWPGGNFVSGYHWLDGVGPKDERPRRTDLAWYAEESNRFGTNEFIEYCREIGNLEARDYVKRARAFAMVMKRTDPTIELVGCGQNGWSEWDEVVLGGL